MTVIEEIAAERQRQIEKEGWSAEHDDGHDKGEIADAAACYAATQRVFKSEVRVGLHYKPFTIYLDLWPWQDRNFKPKRRRRDLIRAAALIIAEIERLDRASRLRGGEE